MKAELDLKAIGKRIRNQREEMNLTREQLAEKLGVSSKFCADIEYGVKGMSVNTLFHLSLVLNLSIDYILKGYEEQEGILSDENRIIRENILLPLSSCTRNQLRRAEQLLKVFVAAVNEEPENYTPEDTE